MYANLTLKNYWIVYTYICNTTHSRKVSSPDYIRCYLKSTMGVGTYQIIYFKLPIWFIGRLKHYSIVHLNHIKLITKYNRVAECQLFSDLTFIIHSLLLYLFRLLASGMFWTKLFAKKFMIYLCYRTKIKHDLKWVGVLTTHIWKYLRIVSIYQSKTF